MTSQRDTLGWLKQGARAFAFGNPLYGLTLGGRGVTGLAAVPNDPWPGDSDMGAAIMDGVFPFARRGDAGGRAGLGAAFRLWADVDLPP